MSAVVDFIYSQSPKQQEILAVLHDYLLQEKKLTAKLRYGIPFYYQNSWICYMNPLNGDGIELAFLRANEFEDPTGLLQANGRKQVKGISIYSVDEMPFDSIEEVIDIAIKLDKDKKYASKRVN